MDAWNTKQDRFTHTRTHTQRIGSHTDTQRIGSHTDTHTEDRFTHTQRIGSHTHARTHRG